MSAATITLEPARELETKALTFSDRARALAIIDQQTFDAAGEMLVAIKGLRAEAESHHRPIIDAAHKAHKAALDGLKKIDGPLAEAESIIKPKISGYLQEQERIRLEAERKAREEAERLEAERLESAIVEAEQNGASVEEVAAMCEQPMPIAMPAPVAPAVRPVYGVSTAKTYRVEVISIRELCKAVAMGQVPETYVAANMPTLNGVARATKGAVRIPGCRVVEDSVVRAAGRR